MVRKFLRYRLVFHLFQHIGSPLFPIWRSGPVRKSSTIYGNASGLVLFSDKAVLVALRKGLAGHRPRCDRRQYHRTRRACVHHTGSGLLYEYHAGAG